MWVGRSGSAWHSQPTESHLSPQGLASESSPRVSDIPKSPVRMGVLAGDGGLEEIMLKKQPGPAWERCGLEGSRSVLDPPLPEAGLLQGFLLSESKIIAASQDPVMRLCHNRCLASQLRLC